MKIVVRHVRPPIPIRGFDWSAVTDNYERGSPMGFGEIQDQAIADLFNQLDDDTTAQLRRACDCGARSGQWGDIHHPSCSMLDLE